MRLPIGDCQLVQVLRRQSGPAQRALNFLRAFLMSLFLALRLACVLSGFWKKKKKGHGSMTCQSHKTKLMRGWVSSPSQGFCSHIHLLLKSFQSWSTVSKKSCDGSGFNRKNNKCCWKVRLKPSSLVSIWLGRAQGSESVCKMSRNTMGMRSPSSGGSWGSFMLREDTLVSVRGDLYYLVYLVNFNPHL